MSNYQEVLDLTTTSLNSAGQAEEKFAIYQDSLEARLNELKATWEGFVISLQESDFFKGVIDFLIFLVNNLPTVITLVTSLGIAIKSITVFKTLQMQLQQMETFNRILQVTTATTTTNTVAQNANNMSKIAGTAATQGLTSAMSALSLVISAVSAVIAIGSMAVLAYQGYIQGLQDDVHQAQEEFEALESEINNLDSVIDNYKEIISSTDSVTEKKAGLETLQKNLNDAYGEEAKQIDLVNGSYKKQIELLDDLEKSKVTEQLAKLQTAEESNKKLLETETTNLLFNRGDWDNFSSDFKKRVEKAIKDAGGTTGFDWVKGFGEYTVYATGETLPKIVESLQKLQQQLISEGRNNEAQEIAKALNKDNVFTADMMEDYEKFSEAAQQKDEERLLKFKLNNWEETQTYKRTLNERSDLLEEYNKTTDKKRKAELYKLLQENELAVSNLQEQIRKANPGYDDLIEEYFGSFSIEKIFKTDPDAISYFPDIVKAAGGLDTVAGKNINNFGKAISQLDEQFETGQITAKEYFEGIGKQIGNIDISKIDDLYGGIKNFNAMLTSIAGNSASYLETLFSGLQSGSLDEWEYYEGFNALVNNITLLGDKIESAYNSGVYETQEDRGAKVKAALEDEIKTREVYYGRAKEIHDRLLELDEDLGTTKNVPAAPTTQKQNTTPSYPKVSLYQPNSQQSQIAPSLSKEEKELVDKVKERVELQEELNQLEEEGKAKREEEYVASEGLNTEVENLKSSLQDIKDMDFGGLDKAFETLDEAFASGKLDSNVEMTLSQVDSSIQNAAMKMATFLKEQTESTNEAIRNSALVGLENMGLTADATTEQIATAIMNTTSNLNAAATASNQIASTAMGRTIQQLGETLVQLGEAMEGFEVDIPIKIPKITFNWGALVPGSDASLIGLEGEQEAHIKIGVAGTVSSIGEQLKKANVADALGKLWEPVQAKVTPKTGTNGITPGASGGGSSSKDKAAEEAAKLAEKITDFREDEGTALEDVTEELLKQYSIEKDKLKLQQQNLEYAQDLYDSEENTTEWLKVQNQLLKNQRKQIQENYRENSKIQQQLDKIQSENSQYDINSWFSVDNESTLAYKNLLNSFAIQEQEYRATVQLGSEEDIEAAKKHIEEIKKQREYVENVFESAQKLKQAWKENNEEIQELLVNMNDNLKETRNTLLDKFMNQLEKQVDKTNQAYEDNISKLESLITVQERYNDVINNALDTQAELEKELRANKNSYQYLDDYMRSIIFNEDDYKELSAALDDIMSDMDKLAEDYQNQINSLTEDEMYKVEEITNEYERQVDLKSKEYDLLKAQLDVVKARTKLENAQNERTVRMYTEQGWQWVFLKK